MRSWALNETGAGLDLDKKLDMHTGDIAGVTIVPLRVIADDRGAVLHMLRCDADDFTAFGECYFSEVAPTAVKAWKKHLAQTQNLAVPVGRIRLVIFDERAKSPTKGNILVVELGRPDAYQRVTIPPGLWYGFSCISESPALIANCADQPHSKSESVVLDVADTLIPYSWQENTM
jgi:dTDP-4-dehydrorhamnose 3,5-epimerase